MLTRIATRLRIWRRRVSRSEWLARMMKLRINERDPDAPALVLIQIDGLARPQFDRALAEGKLPFLKKLIEREHYHVDDWYSGVPATTPAVQAEVFYGVRAAVPAFGFMSADSHEMLRMYESHGANKVEQRLLDEGHQPLLKGGSCYVSSFRGGADNDEAHFCPASKGWGSSLREAGPLALITMVLANLWSLIRTIGLLLLELVLSIVDFFRGLIKGQDFMRELMFIPTRIAITILMRELSTVGVKIDIARGLPIIYVNLLGYDEQSHRRGPSSKFAHWTLKGIDDAVARIWRAAHRSSRRHYDVWIYSDHGQDDTTPYEDLHGRSFADAVSEALSGLQKTPGGGRSNSDRGVQLQRVRLFGGQWVQKLFPVKTADEQRDQDAPMALSAMGPLALLYNIHCKDIPQQTIARILVEQAKAPMVLYADHQERVIGEDGKQLSKIKGWWREGAFSLPEDGHKVLGNDHPFLEETTEDLAHLCRHPEAGDFIASGWCAGGESITFAIECGSHGGASRKETHGFALMPGDIHFPDDGRGHWRPRDLRNAALAFLRAQPAQKLKSAPPNIPAKAAPIITSGRRQKASDRQDYRKLRVMTYNVHICKGMDGKLSPERIARVIARYSPDIVALQEVDVRRQRTGGVDQAHQISRLLSMDCHFQPAMHLEDERYGDAIMTRLPMRLVKKDIFPGPSEHSRMHKFAEPRGALWMEINFHGTLLQVFNTHLGLSKGERLRQVDALLGPNWIGNPECPKPRILVGDFNALPSASEIRRLTSVLEDAQLQLPGHKPKGTFFSRLPKARIDYVFVDSELKVTDVHVPRSELTRLASDHLPLIVDLKIPIDAPGTADDS
ncbi:endonuclease/exonuclease/phosphatase family protein [Microbulbifer sp. ARAS458-1]|uniref:endonuclease/exonuclease/phosphatase family protein n=1 Tax=Microbulbifer sp. ARAS458-1 TaxID=3140242 RepID=UPI003877A2AC